MAVTERQRAAAGLLALTYLSEEDVLVAIGRAAEAVEDEAQMDATHAPGGVLTVTFGSGGDVAGRCTCSAEVTSDGTVRHLRIGRLETPRRVRTGIFHALSCGRRSINGVVPYERFLVAVSGAIEAADPAAAVSVAGPSR